MDAAVEAVEGEATEEDTEVPRTIKMKTRKTNPTNRLRHATEAEDEAEEVVEISEETEVHLAVEEAEISVEIRRRWTSRRILEGEEEGDEDEEEGGGAGENSGEIREEERNRIERCFVNIKISKVCRPEFCIVCFQIVFVCCMSEDFF